LNNSKQNLAEIKEGSGGSQLVNLIRHFGYNKDVDIELGTVTADAPAIKVKIDNMKIELDAADLVVSEHLTAHTRHIQITATGNANITSTSVSSVPSSTYTSFTLSDSDLTVTDATLDYLDELKTGDRVIVASVNNGQLYIVLDRAVTYGS
jgi:hypothetical protein